MHESDREAEELRALLDDSYARAGSHLASIVAPEKRLSVTELLAYLVGVRHLVVATTSASGDPYTSGVDGLFLHGRFWFTTDASSLKARHLAARPAVSATHLVGDTVGVWVHGRARLVAGASPAAAELAPHWRAQYGSAPEEWRARPEDARYVAIEPAAMFAYCHDREGLAALTARGGATP